MMDEGGSMTTWLTVAISLEKVDGRLTDDKLTSSHPLLIILTQIENVQGWGV